MGYSEQIKTVFDKEIEALNITKDSIGSELNDIIDALSKCEGKVVFSGIGKSGHISAKIASTFSSLGICILPKQNTEIWGCSTKPILLF